MVATLILCILPNRGLKRLDVGGMLPGLISKTRYQELNITIQQGERVAFYTDGLFESANDQESRNRLEQGLCDLLLSTLKEPIDVSLAIVYGAVRSTYRLYSQR